MSKNLFRLDSKKTTNFTENRSATPEGFFKPLSKNAKDPREGYSAIIRLLPNFTQEKDIGETNAIRLTSFYIDIPEYPEWNGKIYSKTNFQEKCPLGLLYGKFDKSEDDDVKKKTEMFKKTTKYYSYVLVIEDENVPENEGKVLIWEFGSGIKAKIESEMKGKNKKKESCNVYDLATGKDLQILVTGVGQKTNYDGCKFDDNTSPLFIKGKGAIPTEVDDEDGREIIHKDYQDMLVKFLLKRKKNLEELMPEPWDDETIDKVNQIVSYLNGATPMASANRAINNAAEGKPVKSEAKAEAKTTAPTQASNKGGSSSSKGGAISAAAFFGDMEDED